MLIKLWGLFRTSASTCFKNFFIPLFYFFKYFIDLFLDRGERRQKEMERNINVWLPHTGEPGPQPRHVPWLGIEP